MTVFLVIYKAENFTAEIEYIPLENGVIEIVSFHVEAHPRSIFEWRNRSRRWQPYRQQLLSDPRDEQ